MPEAQRLRGSTQQVAPLVVSFFKLLWWRSGFFTRRDALASRGLLVPHASKRPTSSMEENFGHPSSFGRCLAGTCLPSEGQTHGQHRRNSAHVSGSTLPGSALVQFARCTPTPCRHLSLSALSGFRCPEKFGSWREDLLITELLAPNARTRRCVLTQKIRTHGCGDHTEEGKASVSPLLPLLGDPIGRQLRFA